MSEQKFETWAIVEVMGHNRFAGFVSEQSIGVATLLRIDVPEVGDMPAFVKLIGVGSIFAITPCTEQTARAAQKSFRTRPFAMFGMPMLLGTPRERELFEEEDYDDDE